MESDETSRLVEALSRSHNSAHEQIATMHQALEAILAFLESQSANLPPKVDLADILGRLKDLEEQNRALQGQFSASR